MIETQRRRQIDDVASELFRERGYAATSVRDIARALDIQGGSLYAHVSSKEDVLWSIVQRTADAFEHSADEALASSADPVARLAAFARAHVSVVTADPRAATVFVHEWRNLSPDRREAVLGRRDRYERRLVSLIQEGIAAGTFEPTDARLAAAFVLSALNGVAAWYRPGGRLQAAQIADACADLCVSALEEAGR
jgi:AcrR family transcriptional regulator